MANCLVLYPNRGDASALSGGSWQLPLTNLQDRIIQRVARTTNLQLASTQMAIALPAPRNIRAVILVGQNLTTSARKRVRVYGVNDELVWQTGDDGEDGWEDVYPRERPTELMEWRDENWWSGRPLAENLRGTTQYVITILPTMAFTKRITVEIDDRGNPAGYLEFGRLFLSGQYQPSLNYKPGGTVQFDVRSTSARSLGGTLYHRRRKHPRLMAFGWDFLPEEEMFSRVYEIQRQAGTDEEVFWIEDPDDVVNRQRLSWLGRLRELPPLARWTAMGRGSASFLIEEII